MLRRRTLAWLAVAAGCMPVGAAGGAMVSRRLATPAPLAQIAVGGPSGLLGLGRGGQLWALAVQTGSPQQLADGLDPDTPLAIGHGRIAARRQDGALWVLEDGRVSLSAPRQLAPAAGMLVLPLGIVAIANQGSQHRAVRLERSGATGWALVSQSDVDVLPDARPVQADLDGDGDAGHIALLAGPDSTRYVHGVLGDGIEATRLVWLERHSLRTLRESASGEAHVFEDIAPRRVSLGSRDGLLTVRAGPSGGQLVLIDADPAAPGALRFAASGPPMGSARRWLAPTTDGHHWLAVHTPHIGGVLHAYRQDAGRLLAQPVRPGVSNHRIGSRWLDMAAWHGQRLLMPDQQGRRLWLLDPAADWQAVGELSGLPSVLAILSLGRSNIAAVLHEDGGVSAVSLPA